MGDGAAIALCLTYPYPGQTDKVRRAARSASNGTVRRHLQRFLEEVEPLGNGGWEELHTRTLDLSPQFVPYVGHVTWGESYHRGAFMARLKGAMATADVGLEGELPDHLEPILRYLDAVDEPDEELSDVLPGAVAAMAKELKKADPDNPYRHVLAAAGSHVAGETHVEIRRSQ